MLIDEDKKCWKQELVEAVFNKDEANLICAISISNRGSCDRLIWAGSAKGIFIVNNAYFKESMSLRSNLGESSFSGDNEAQWKEVWKLGVPRKVKQLLWKCLNNILPTNVNLSKKKIIESNLCPICKREAESVVHVLWSCSAVTDVWGGETSLFRKWHRNFAEFHLPWSEMVLKVDQDSLDLAAVIFH